MTSVRNRRIILSSRPESLPTEANYSMTEAEVPVPGEGGVLARILMLSIDPAMRGWVLETPNYAPPVPVGDVMRGFGVAEVVESKSSKYQVGDIVTAMTGWQEWCVLTDDNIQRRVDPSHAPISTSLGVLGVTGITAYVGMVEIGKPTAGSTAVVSTAAGSVGSAAGQLAALHGARTVGLTGSDEKVRMCLDEFGFDAAINYKTSKNLAADLAAACPDGIDVYFENVGGVVLEAVLGLINRGARIPLCGLVSQYNMRPLPPGPNLIPLLTNRARIHGFLVLDHYDRFDAFVREVGSWVRSGELRYREDIVDGIDAAPQALIGLLEGKNFGKLLVRVSPDPSR